MQQKHCQTIRPSSARLVIRFSGHYVQWQPALTAPEERYYGLPASRKNPQLCNWREP